MSVPAQEIGATVDDAAEGLDRIFRGMDGETDTQETIEEGKYEAKNENEGQEEYQEAVRDDEVSTDDTGQKESGQSENQEPEATNEERGFETLTDFAEATGTDLNNLMSSVSASVIVNGKESSVTLSELRDGYQREADYTEKTTSLANERNQFKTDREAANKDAFDRVVKLDGLIQAVEKQLSEDYQSTNWAELRELDPAEFAAKRQEFNDKQHSINQIKGNAVTAYEAQQQQIKDRDSATFANLRDSENTKLSCAVKEWSDSSVFEADKGKIKTYLNEFGFGNDDVDNILDHKVYLIARKAMLYDAAQTQGKVVDKKVRSLPRLLKPGAKKSAEQQARESRSGRMQELKKSGHVDDAARLLFDMIED